MSDNTQLKPCPFCGSLDVDPAGTLRGDGRRSPECETCGATTDTVELWNTRAYPAEEFKAEVERLKSELAKVRELLTDLKYWAPSKGQVMIDRFLAHQSAPAAKGGE